MEYPLTGTGHTGPVLPEMSSKLFLPPGNTDRDDRPATVRHDRPVLPSSPGQRSKKRPKVQGTEKIGEQKTLPDSEYQVREARTSNMLRNGGFPGGEPPGSLGAPP